MPAISMHDKRVTYCGRVTSEVHTVSCVSSELNATTDLITDTASLIRNSCSTVLSTVKTKSKLTTHYRNYNSMVNMWQKLNTWLNFAEITWIKLHKGLKTGPNVNLIRPCLVKMWGPHINFLTLIYNKKAKLWYRKDDHAMHPKYGCPENFRESLTMPTPTFPEIFYVLLFRLNL